MKRARAVSSRLGARLAVVPAMLALLLSVLTLPPSAVLADDARARFDYILNCAGCHRTDALGSQAAPALTDLGRLLAVADGRSYLVRVPGVAQAPLSDERLAALLNWTLAEFSSVAGDVAAYTAAEVSRLRAEPLRAPSAERRRILGE